MKNIFLSLLFLFSLSYSFSQTLTDEEKKLYNLIMDYRIEKDLPKITVSKSLTYVAQLHVQDLANNQPDQGECNSHSWSSKGKWTPCCYTSDHAKASCMWSKPSELTSYKDNGFEIAFWTSGIADALGALEGWKGSSAHNAVILNKGIWDSYKWNAIGIGIYKGYAVVWFGETEEK